MTHITFHQKPIRNGKDASPSCTAKIHDSFNQFGAAADGLLTSTGEEEITVLHGINKQGEFIQRLDIKLIFV